jgi:hypothetical protein
MQQNSGVSWSPIMKAGNFHKASRFGRVLFAQKDWVPPAAPAASAPSPVEKAVLGAKAVLPGRAFPPGAPAAAKSPALPQAAVKTAPAPSAK